MLKTLYVLLIIASLVVILAVTQLPGLGTSTRSKEASKEFYENYRYMHNNNLMQYSAYLIGNAMLSEFEVHAFVQFNFKFVRNFENKTEFRCLLKNGERIVELEIHETPKMYWDRNKKFICRCKQDSMSLSDYVGVAVIRRMDYHDDSQLVVNSSVGGIVLPFSLVNFQLAKVVYAAEPRRKSVGFCVHYTYGISPQFFQWLEIHLEFGYAEIVVYDATPNKNLTKLLKSKYDERVTVKPYNIQVKEDVCDEHRMRQQRLKSDETEILLHNCHEFYKHEFSDKIGWRSKHEQLSSNDCFTELSQSHEFVAYYDLDEFVYPRRMANETLNYKCNDFNSICSTKPFINIYSYLRDLVKAYGNNKDFEKLGSISFDHGVYIKSNYIEKSMMLGLSNIIEGISAIRFPTLLFLSEPLSNKGYSFIIEDKDVEFIRSLHSSYYLIVPCAYNTFIKNITTLDTSLLRHLYFITEANQRMGKTVHYSKNIKSIFTHYAQDAKAGTWFMTAPALKGHFLGHFRLDTAHIILRNFTNSIRKLNVDIGYMVYLLQNHTSFCKMKNHVTPDVHE